MSYCYPDTDRIREGVRRLAAVIESELDLAHTFGTTHALADSIGQVNPAPDIA